MSRARREKLSDMLVWLEKKQKNPTIKCVREHARFVPSNPHSTLTLADGSVHPCLVIDVSASGVAVSSPVQPPIGMPLAVGACIGRVVRLLPNGIAVKFVEKQNSRALERLTARVGQTEAAADSGQAEPIASGDFVAV